MRISLPARLALLWAVLSSALIAGLGWLLWRGTREHQMEHRRESLRHGASLVQVKLQAAMADVIRDTQYMAATSAVTAFARAAPEERDACRSAVEQDFLALLKGKSYCSQVRFIGMDGAELVRADNTPQGPQLTPRPQLQNKADRDYFRSTMLLRPGETYLSDMNLNQEFGKIAEPWVITVRGGAVVMADAAVRGILVINVDLGPLLDELSRMPESGVRLQVANGAGDYLIHPDPFFLFGTDLGRTARFMSDPRAAEDSLIYEQTFPLHAQDGRSASVRLQLSAAELLSGLSAARNGAVLITVAAAIGGAVVVALFVRKAVARLEAARLTAEEAARVREDFLAQMSHEIRTPMNAVTGLLGVLERNRPAPHQMPVLRSLRAASRNLMGLLNDALDWSKIRAGMMEFESTTFDLHTLLDEIELTHRPLAMQKGLILEAEIAGELPEMVRGDPLRLSQVLNNLLGNALKFTTDGFVRLGASALRVSDDCWQAVFTVSDSGQGIPPETLPRIFDPFVQGGPGAAQRFGGSGLGLGISRRLVTLQGGSLDVESVPGTGTSFTVRLPLGVAEARECLPAVSRKAVPRLPGLRVLYVEDVASNREVMDALMAGTGAILTFAETGSDALRLAESPQAFDLALLDLQLPDMSGLEVARRLRAVCPLLPMLAVTAQALPATRQECKDAGMADVISKPIDRDALLSAITALVPGNRLAGTPDLANLEADFAGDSVRFRRVLLGMAGEFRGHAGELLQAADSADPAALRRLRHRMTTALSSLRLDELRAVLDRLAAGGGTSAEAVDAARSMEETAGRLEKRAGLLPD